MSTTVQILGQAPTERTTAMHADIFSSYVRRWIARFLGRSMTPPTAIAKFATMSQQTVLITCT